SHSGQRCRDRGDRARGRTPVRLPSLAFCLCGQIESRARGLRDREWHPRAAYLARAAACLTCHTTQGGKQYAGGLGFKLPFGTLYSTNITPDKDTGIGNYGDKEFLNAVQRGIRHDGARLYPAMPYASYTYISDADALAIKAYLFSL